MTSSQTKEIISKATHSKRIKADLKYAEYNWKAAISKINVICAIKEKPDEITLSLLFDCIVKDYSSLTWDEIFYAFIENQKGNLTKTHQHFGLIDLKFFCSVLNDYLQIRKTAVQEIEKQLTEPQPQTDSPESSYLYLVDYYTKNGDFPDYFSYNTTYSYMDENGMIPETNPEKSTIYDAVKHRLTNTIKLEELKIGDSIRRSTLWDNFEDRVKIECRKILVQKYIVKFVESNEAEN